MRLLKLSEEGFVFRVSRREKEILLTILTLYPRIPSGYHRLSKSADPVSGDQALLEESLQEQRNENQQHVRRLLANPAKWAQADSSWRLTISESEIEWLLQVLNDIRVGSWVRLGSPEGNLPIVNEENAPDLWAMEVAGSFQIALLEALRGKA